jgi:Fe2+ transport system protein B
MFELFKDKKKIKIDSEENGYNKGYSDAEKKYRIRMAKQKKEFETILVEHEEKINVMRSYIDKIENDMEGFAHVIARSKFLAIKLEEESELELQKFANQHQEFRKISGELSSVSRVFEKKYPGIEKKINDFKKINLQ